MKKVISLNNTTSVIQLKKYDTYLFENINTKLNFFFYLPKYQWCEFIFTNDDRNDRFEPVFVLV